MQDIVKNPLERINEAIADYTEELDLCRKVVKALTPFDGKKPTARMESAVRNLLGEQYSVAFTKSYSWYELSVWGNGIPYSNRFNVNVGYITEGNFNLDRFINHHAQRYLLNEGRIAKLEASKEGLEDRINEYKNAQAAFQRALNALGDAGHFVLV